MNDFLSNVIAKNFDSSAVIQPRLPSLFEPPRAAGKLLAEQPAGFADWETAPPAAENTFDFHEPDLTMARRAFTPYETTMTMKPKTQEPPSQPRQPAVETEWEKRSSRTALDAAPIEWRLPPSSNLWPATDEPPTVRRATPMMQAALLPPKRDENVMEPLRNAPESPRPDAPASPVIERVIAPTALQPSAVAAKGPSVIAQPQIKPYVAPIFPAPVKSVEKPEPAPTIQVTIGRIEVRATPAAPPSKRQPPTAPVMSLDEYLRQRAGGGTQ